MATLIDLPKQEAMREFAKGNQVPLEAYVILHELPYRDDMFVQVMPLPKMARKLHEFMDGYSGILPC